LAEIFFKSCFGPSQKQEVVFVKPQIHSCF